jgi:DNA-3-methyladenine glycosylase I
MKKSLTNNVQKQKKVIAKTNKRQQLPTATTSSSSTSSSLPKRQKLTTTAAAAVDNTNTIQRCPWLPQQNIEYVHYHDKEWGTPQRNPHGLFESLVLEGCQAGLSWATILKKREAFREIFHQFNPHTISKSFTLPSHIDAIMQDDRIIRHRGKLEAIVHNAKLVVKEYPDLKQFVDFIWSFQPDPTSKSATVCEGPCDEATKLSNELKKRGYKFVGPTTIQSFFQACGLVNHHHKDCFLYNNGKQ